MMFRRREKLLFVHIPKNAGNSVRRVCKKKNIRIITHNIRRRNKRLLAYYRDKNQRVHAFCVCRNPYDRVVSAYFYLLNQARHRKDMADRQRFIDPYEGFTDFVLNGLREAAKEQLHFLPQVFWIRNSEGTPQIESVLRMENLQKDFDAFCQKMNLKPVPLDITNTSARQPWSEYHTPETKKVVEAIYREDFDFFGYGFF